MTYIPVISALLLTAVAVYIFRKKIVAWLLRLRGQLWLQSLRGAIHDADKDKSKTGRKNLVVWNTVSGAFEPLQKRQLKAAARNTKNKNNAAMTPGRKRAMSQQGKQKKRLFTTDAVKRIEDKSPYVTK